MKGFWDSLGIKRAYVSCWLLVKKVFLKKSAMSVYVVSCMSHRTFLHCSLDALYRGATEDFCNVFRHSWEGFETNRGLRGRFLLPGGIFVVFFRCPVQGGNRGFLHCL